MTCLPTCNAMGMPKRKNDSSRYASHAGHTGCVAGFEKTCDSRFPESLSVRRHGAVIVTAVSIWMKPNDRGINEIDPVGSPV